MCKIGINIFVVFFVASRLNVTDFGSFSLAFVFSALFISIFDYGLNLKSLTLAGKEISIISKDISLMLYTKVFIVFISLIAFTIFLVSNKYDVITNKAIAILVLSSVPISFGNFYVNSFKIFHNFKSEAIGFVIQALLILILIVFNEFYGENNIITYTYIIAIARTIYFLYAFLIFQKRFTIVSSFARSDILNTIKTTTPYAVHLILGSSIIYIDTFVLSFLSSLDDVGIYQAGMRIIMAGMLISVILSDAFIPEISSLKKKKNIAKNKLKSLFEFVIFFAVLTSTLIFFFKETIITLLFNDEYLALNTFVFYIILILFLRYIGIVPGIILTSFSKQNVRANAVVISVIVSVVLNWVLIPVLGIEGAFISSLIAHVVLNIIYVYKSFKTVSFFVLSKQYLVIFALIVLNLTIQIIFLKDSFSNFIIAMLLSMIVLVLYLKYTKWNVFLNPAKNIE
ncbi:oligosaccharide flippase family protein [Pseudotenacibaculum sp. MALMAid0570]|uniref:oligosaccharide flippase family protein n=1 Tax=Pseudotenacibaculum sp. MALMAid0570 TaxID=3143938 RepID=UPI0032DEE201